MFFFFKGTMEEKIYQRQVTKQSLSQRVCDEHQLERHFTSQELRELYAFEPDAYNDDDEEAMTLPVPDDDVLAEVILQCRRWLFRYHEHDLLLENRLDEILPDEERKAAWEEYEREKNTRTIHTNPNTTTNATTNNTNNGNNANSTSNTNNTNTGANQLDLSEDESGFNPHGWSAANGSQTGKAQYHAKTNTYNNNKYKKRQYPYRKRRNNGPNLYRKQKKFQRTNPHHYHWS